MNREDYSAIVSDLHNGPLEVLAGGSPNRELRAAAQAEAAARGHMLTPRLEYRRTVFGLRIYVVNAGTLYGVKRPADEMMAAILDFSNRVRADNRGEAALILSRWEYAALATELQAANEVTHLPAPTDNTCDIIDDISDADLACELGRENP